MDKLTDDILIKHIQQHNQKALEVLFERYFYSLCNFAFSIVDNIEMAEEVVSDVFFNIWTKRGQITINSTLKGYLFLATKNQSINYLKKEKPWYKEMASQVVLPDVHEQIKADTGIEYTEFEREIQVLLEGLPPQRRLIFKLHRLEGLKYKEIAERLSISVNTVQKQMSEAAKHIDKNKPRLKALLYTSCLLIFFLIPN